MSFCTLWKSSLGSTSLLPHPDVQILHTVIRMESIDICESRVPLVGRYNPQRYIKEMYMHERQAKDTFSSEKMSITLILNIRMAQSSFCSGLTWRGSAPRRHQWHGVATGQLDSTGKDLVRKGGRSERRRRYRPRPLPCIDWLRESLLP